MKTQIKQAIGVLLLMVVFLPTVYATTPYKGKVLLIAANPAVSKQTGWPIGAWAAEIVHPYYAFTEAGYQVDIASPDGGKIVWDGYSDPEDPSGYSAHDILSLGFKKNPATMGLLDKTTPLAAVKPDQYKAIFLCGGQSPMYTFIDNAPLHKFVSDFYATGKPTAIICHATCVLLKVKDAKGQLIVTGKRWTGFADFEEQYADNFVGKQIQPFRIETEARKIANTKFQVAPAFQPHAIQDGNLITGQQQYSGTAATELVLKQLEKDKAKLPTYVLVHGAFANDLAWDAVRNELATKANVISFDLPGHGKDFTNPKSVSMDTYVKAVVSAINQADGKVVLVGHSMAGMIVSAVAEAIPAKISKLVFLAAYVPQNGQSLQALAEKDKESLVGKNMVFAPDYSTVTIKAEAIPQAIAADLPEPLQQMLVKYHAPEPLKPFAEKVSLTKAKAGSIPRYYIRTLADKAVTPALQDQMIKADGTFKKVYDIESGHLPFLSRPAELVTILETIRQTN